MAGRSVPCRNCGRSEWQADDIDRLRARDGAVVADLSVAIAAPANHAACNGGRAIVVAAASEHLGTCRRSRDPCAGRRNARTSQRNASRNQRINIAHDENTTRSMGRMRNHASTFRHHQWPDGHLTTRLYAEYDERA